MKITIVFLLMILKVGMLSSQNVGTAIYSNEAQQLNALVQPGNFIAAEKTAHGITIQTSNAYISVIAYGETIIRIRLMKGKNGIARDFSYAVVAAAAGD